MAKIKICGLRRSEDISYVNELRPDFAGFIMSRRFRRYAENIDELLSLLSEDITSVGVFVDEPVEYVNSLDFDLVQLHGNESCDYCKQINKPVIKMLKPADFDKIPEYEACVDYLLLDSGAGTGKAFDWSLIPKTQTPFFLAGGLGADNIEQAIKTVNPYAVDLSSYVETDGVKDYEKIRNIINIVRRIENE